MTVLTPGDIDIGWRTVWMEARGESREGKEAVVHVLFNRLEYRIGDRWNTIAQVCLDWLQFSGWRENDPSFVKAQTIDLNTSSARTALGAFLAAWSQRPTDPTKGSRHYYADSIPAPKWAVGHQPCLVLGHHRFFNDVA